MAFDLIERPAFGEPIPVAPYLEVYREDPSKVVDALTRAIQRAIEAELVHVERIEATELVRAVEGLYRGELISELLGTRGLTREQAAHREVEPALARRDVGDVGQPGAPRFVRQPRPPRAMDGSAFSASGMSVMSTSVVSSHDAIEVAFSRAPEPWPGSPQRQCLTEIVHCLTRSTLCTTVRIQHGDADEPDG